MIINMAGGGMHVVLSAFFLLQIITCQAATPPKIPRQYFASGVLRLPYTEINEPFAAYYDQVGGRSRIDYYGDMMQTFQLGSTKPGDFGVGYKVTYMTDHKVYAKRTCFQINGSKEAFVKIQSVYPSLEGFKPIATGVFWTNADIGHSFKVDIWQNVTVNGGKENTYTLYVDSTSGSILRYQMFGYDSLFGSHYDKYNIDYFNMTASNFSKATFMPNPGLKCGNFPGPGVGAEHSVLTNPMSEYIGHRDEHVSEMFEKFKNVHQKKYETGKDEAMRKGHFRQNVRFIHSKNRAVLGYTLDVNHLADRTVQELKYMRGRLSSSGYNGGLPFDKTKYNVKDLPKDIDWRLFGAVTPVKDQAVCGSCWSFGSTGTIEGSYFLKMGRRVRLSQQELMDCSWGEGNNACDGGEEFRAYQWIMKNGGLAAEDQYGPYLGSDGKCHSRTSNTTVNLKSYVNVTSGDLDALKMAVANHGPISVGIDAAHLSLSFYSSGVYYEDKCGNKPDDLDHAVLAVGYGVMKDQPYWLIKNSWSTYWGDAGYVLMSMKDNNCGVATAATYVNLDI